MNLVIVQASTVCLSYVIPMNFASFVKASEIKIKYD